MFLHPAIIAHLLTFCSSRTRESAVAINLAKIPPPGSPVYSPPVEVNLAALLQVTERRWSMCCSISLGVEVLAEDRNGAITHRWCAGAWPSMS